MSRDRQRKSDDKIIPSVCEVITDADAEKSDARTRLINDVGVDVLTPHTANSRPPIRQAHVSAACTHGCAPARSQLSAA